VVQSMRIRSLTYGLVLLAAATAAPSGAAISCYAEGTLQPNANGSFTYIVSVTWDFNGIVVPDRVALVLEHLDDCPYIDPENPSQSFLIPRDGWSDAEAGCLDEGGSPTDEIVWKSTLELDDPDCWAPHLQISYANTGPTASCLPLTADTGRFTFSSFASPLPAMEYYNVVVIHAGSFCIYCDYIGPLPDCEPFTPAGQFGWGMIKALYR